jgi:hypothetical protein
LPASCNYQLKYKDDVIAEAANAGKAALKHRQTRNAAGVTINVFYDGDESTYRQGSARAILAVGDNDNEIAEYSSVKVAAQALGISEEPIRKIINGQSKPEV